MNTLRLNPVTGRLAERIPAGDGWGTYGAVTT